MANFTFTPAKVELGKGTVNLNGGDDIRVMILMTNTSAPTDEDAATISAITTLDKHDGAGYVNKSLANEIMNTDLPNNRGEFDADNLTWTSLGAGTRAIQALLVFKFITSEALSLPLFYLDTPAPPNSNGGDWTAGWSAEGIAQIT